MKNNAQLAFASIGISSLLVFMVCAIANVGGAHLLTPLHFGYVVVTMVITGGIALCMSFDIKEVHTRKTTFD